MFPLGVTTVVFTAVDSVGNVGQSQAAVTISDTTPPTVTPPSNLHIDIGTASSIPSTDPHVASFLDGATASDTVTDVVVVMAINVPATFPVGKNTVTFSAQDAAGNTGTATAILTIVRTPTQSGNRSGGGAHDPLANLALLTVL